MHIVPGLLGLYSINGMLRKYPSINIHFNITLGNFGKPIIFMNLPTNSVVKHSYTLFKNKN